MKRAIPKMKKSKLLFGKYSYIYQHLFLFMNATTEKLDKISVLEFRYQPYFIHKLLHPLP
jgi:hypothetical protein